MRTHIKSSRIGSSRVKTNETGRAIQQKPPGRSAKRFTRIDAADQRIKAALLLARAAMFRSPNWATEFEGMDAS